MSDTVIPEDLREIATPLADSVRAHYKENQMSYHPQHYMNELADNIAALERENVSLSREVSKLSRIKEGTLDLIEQCMVRDPTLQKLRIAIEELE